ncbi:hypothetical protein ACGLFO_10535, partial [Corynebacterium hesseae]
DPEPLPDGHPLYDLPNATLTPHMAASDHVAQYHLGAIFNANAAAWERGEDMPSGLSTARIPADPCAWTRAPWRP